MKSRPTLVLNTNLLKLHVKNLKIVFNFHNKADVTNQQWRSFKRQTTGMLLYMEGKLSSRAYVFWGLLLCITRCSVYNLDSIASTTVNNPGHKILVLYNILVQVRFTISKTKLNNCYSKLGIRVVSRVETSDCRKSGNIRNI